MMTSATRSCVKVRATTTRLAAPRAPSSETDGLRVEMGSPSSFISGSMFKKRLGCRCCCVSLVTIFCCYAILFVHLLNTTSELNANDIAHKIPHTHAHNRQCKSSVYQIFRHQCCYEQFAINYLYSLGFTHVDDDIPGKSNRYYNSTILWNRNKEHILGCHGLNIQQRNEQIADPMPIIYKTKIYQIVMSYCIQHQIQTDCERFLPDSYDLRKQNERIEFFKLLECNNEPNNEWILKGDRHRGKSIKFIKNTNYLRYFHLKKNEQYSSNPDCIVTEDDINDTEYKQFKRGSYKDMVAQQLILNTLKIDNCSFHIRSWIFLANYNDPLIVLYVDSILYKAVDPNNLITNYNLAADGSSAVKWNMKQFADYFDAVNVTDIVDKIKNMLKILYLASFEEYNPSMKGIDGQHYMLMAVDLLLTEDLEIQLLEVNSKPGLFWIPRNCFVGETKIKDIWQCKLGKLMMEEIIDIELEIAVKKSNGNKIDKLDSLSAFHIVLWR
eukprot:176478_1